MFPWTFDWEFIFKISRKPFFSRSTSFSFVHSVVMNQSPVTFQILSLFSEKCLIFQVYDDLYKPYTCLTVCVYLNDCPCLLVFWMIDDCLHIQWSVGSTERDRDVVYVLDPLQTSHQLAFLEASYFRRKRSLVTRLNRKSNPWTYVHSLIKYYY